MPLSLSEPPKMTISSQFMFAENKLSFAVKAEYVRMLVLESLLVVS